MKKISYYAIGGVLIVVLALLRATLESRAALGGALTLSPSERQIELLSEAYRWHFPGNPYSGEARAKLLELVATAPQGAIRQLAEKALRRGAYETRSILNPLPDIYVRERAELPSQSSVAVEPEYSRQILTQCLFWGWIIATLICIWRSFEREGAFKRHVFFRTAPWPVLLYLFWLFSLQG